MLLQVIELNLISYILHIYIQLQNNVTSYSYHCRHTRTMNDFRVKEVKFEIKFRKKKCRTTPKLEINVWLAIIKNVS